MQSRQQLHRISPVIGPSEFTPDMMKELDEFLMSDLAPAQSMLIDELDGFLTGIVVGPELIMPAEWFPVIWQEGEPEFEDGAQSERISSIILARYNEIIRQLDDELGAFEPIFLETPDGAVRAENWVEGFMDAFAFRVDAWDPLFETEDGKMLMVPIMAHLHDKDGNPALNTSEEELQTIRDQCAEVLPFAVKGIYDFWKARREPVKFAPRRIGKKVGRNEPCPCGSGRKYKRCCGAR